MRIWFHGTDEKTASKISVEGFRAETWFAKALEDALEFGGPYVFEVALNHKPIDDDKWQRLISDAVGAACIVRLTNYRPVILSDYEERRTKVFEANI